MIPVNHWSLEVGLEACGLANILAERLVIFVRTSRLQIIYLYNSIRKETLRVYKPSFNQEVKMACLPFVLISPISVSKGSNIDKVSGGSIADATKSFLPYYH